jgi:hypothetical protein
LAWLLHRENAEKAVSGSQAHSRMTGVGRQDLPLQRRFNMNLSKPLVTALVSAALLNSFGAAARASDCISWEPSVSYPDNAAPVSVYAYDSWRNVIIVVTPTSIDGVVRTWELINGAWTLQATTSSTLGGPSWPMTRQATGAFRSATGDFLVLAPTNQLWRWNGQSWSELPSLPGQVRHRATMAYDSHRDVMIVFGGVTLAPPYILFNETWEFDGKAWSQVNTATAPSPRDKVGMTYDSHRMKVVMFGGNVQAGSNGFTPSDETWEYDGSTWADRTDAAHPTPPARFNAALVYQPQLGLSFLMRGQNAPNSASGPEDAWSWDGNRWVQRYPIGSFTAGPLAGVYDSVSNAIRTFHMAFGTHYMLEASATMPTVIEHPSSQTVAMGQPAWFGVIAEGSGTLNYQWRRNGTPIPNAVQQMYTIPAVSAEDIGVYDCVVSNAYGQLACGVTLSFGAILTIQTCTADITQDGLVNVNDLLAVINAWGVCP